MSSGSLPGGCSGTCKAQEQRRRAGERGPCGAGVGGGSGTHCLRPAPSPRVSDVCPCTSAWEQASDVTVSLPVTRGLSQSAPRTAIPPLGAAPGMPGSESAVPPWHLSRHHPCRSLRSSRIQRRSRLCLLRAGGWAGSLPCRCCRQWGDRLQGEDAHGPAEVSEAAGTGVFRAEHGSEKRPEMRERRSSPTGLSPSGSTQISGYPQRFIPLHFLPQSGRVQPVRGPCQRRGRSGRP